MARWLLKTEPSDFSFADLERAGRERWNGVRNPTALKHLRAMRPGDLALIYHTGDERAVVGVAEVVSDPYPDPASGDPRFVVVNVAPRRRLARPVSLAEIKAEPILADWALLRQSRLSVMPVTEAQWDWVERAATRPGS